MSVEIKAGDIANGSSKEKNVEDEEADAQGCEPLQGNPGNDLPGMFRAGNAASRVHGLRKLQGQTSNQRRLR